MTFLHNMSIVGAHPSSPPTGDYNLYVLSTNGHYYLQSSTEIIDLTDAGVSFVTDTNEPTGHIDNSDSTISFVNGTRTFTIQPAVSSFSYYESGTKYTKTTAQNVVIDDTEGIHFIYFDGATLTAVANPTDSQIEIIYKIKALCTILYWDADNDEQILFGEERHGCVMDGETHYFLHAIMGTQYRSGAALNSLVTEGNGSSNTHAQFGVDAGIIADEDLVITLAAVTSTTGLPVYYKSGASGYWRRDFNSGFSIITAGTGRAAYNEWTGSTWQKTEITNTKFACLHVFAVNDITYPYIVIMGQEEYSTKIGAQAGARVEIDTLVTSGMPFVEFKPIATVLIQTSDSYGNDVQTRTREVESGVDYVDWRVSEFSSAGSVTSDHNNLSGLQGGQGGEYYHLTESEHTGLFIDPLTTNGDIIIRDTTTKRLAVGNAGEVLSLVSGLPSWQPSFGADPKKWVVFKEDFIGARLNDHVWSPYSSGTGSSINIRTPTGENGVVYLTAGPSSGRYSEMDFYNTGLSDEGRNFSMRRNLVMKFRIKCSSTSSILAHCGVLFGTDIFIRFTADSANANFHLQTSISAGTNDSVSTSIALDTVWHDVEIRCVYASGVYCYLDGSLVASITNLSRLPTTQYGFGYIRCQAKTTSSKSLDVDYYHAIQKRNDA